MTVEHRQNGDRGSFYVEVDGKTEGEMVYRKGSGSVIIIEHTEVSEVLHGKNVGQELVHAGVEYAREHGLKIVPVCPFAKKVLEKHSEWQDVLA